MDKSIITRVAFVLSWLAVGGVALTIPSPRGFVVAGVFVPVLVTGYLTYMFSSLDLWETRVLAILGNMVPLIGVITGLWLELYPYLWVDLWTLYQYDNGVQLLWLVAGLTLVVSALIVWEVLGIVTYYATPWLEARGGNDGKDLYRTPPIVIRRLVK